MPASVEISAEGKREAILAAALALFSERNFDATPVPMIAAEAGVAAGTVYRYFASKEALVNAVYQTCKTAMGQALARGLAAGAEPRAAFGRVWQGLFAFAEAHPQALRFLELHHHAPYLDATSRAVADEVSDAIVAFVRRAQQTGAVRAGDPVVLIALAYGAFVGLVKEAGEGRLVLSDDVRAASEAAVWALLTPVVIRDS